MTRITTKESLKMAINKGQTVVWENDKWVITIKKIPQWFRVINATDTTTTDIIFDNIEAAIASADLRLQS
jgi:hypothetical protein